MVTPSTTYPGWRKWILRIGISSLFLLFIWRLDFNLAVVTHTILQANPSPLLFAIFLFLPIWVIKTWRWQLILNEFGIRLDFVVAYRLYALGAAAGSCTPGQVGDTIKAYHLRARGYSWKIALFSIVLDRLCDVGLLILLACSSVLLLGANLFLVELPVLVVLALTTSLMVATLLVPALRVFLLKQLNFLLLHLKRWRKTQLFADDNPPTRGSTSWLLLPARSLVLIIVLTSLSANLATFRLWLLALAIGLNCDFLEATALNSLATTASLIIVSIGGIGVRDLTVISVLGKLGYAAEPALSLSALMLLLNAANLVGFLLRPSTLNSRVEKRDVEEAK